MGCSRFTRFVARYTAGSRADFLCFGDPVNQFDIRCGQTGYQFRPGQRFGVLWWRRHSENRQHRALAVVETLADDTMGQILPSIDLPVSVHAMVDQHGPAGQNGAVDQFIELIQELKQYHQNPSAMPGRFWTEAAQQILLDQTLEDSWPEYEAECPV